MHGGLAKARSRWSTTRSIRRTGSVRLKATFPNENHALWPGQFVNIRLLAADPASRS